MKRLAAVFAALTIAVVANAGTACAAPAAGGATIATGRAGGAGAIRQHAGAAFDAGRVVIDGVGRRVTIPQQVNRIVTLAPNLTETVYALGLQDKLVGDTNECDTPAAAKRKPHVGDVVSPSLEAIVALRPDLVLASTSINRPETVEALARIGIPVYTTDAQTVTQMLDSVQRIGEIAGAADQGAKFVAQLRARLEAIHARLADQPVQHVLFVIWDDPLITIGQNTFIEDALRWAGAESVVLSRQKWPQLSMEEVLRLQPDYILYAAHDEKSTQTLQDLRARLVWRDLDAVEAGHVLDLSEEALRPSPGLVGVIEELARELHPDAFRDKTGI